jgi:glycosyltransferase involved in cell wall biosynthesis
MAPAKCSKSLPNEPRGSTAVRVMILHSRYRSGAVSGENRVVQDEARLLAQGGHSVEIFSPSVSDSDASGLKLLRTGVEMIWSKKATVEVRERLQRTRPDIVHCHNLFPALSPAVLRAVDAQIPILMTLHNYRMMCLPGTFLRDGRICEDCCGRVPWPGVVHRCYQGSVPARAALATSLTLHSKVATFDRVALYLAISGFVRDKHVEGGLSPDRVVVKPHFAWPSQQREGCGRFFLYLGRLAPEKGVATLLKMWRRTEAKLVIAGDGPQLRYLRSLAPPNVQFLGAVSSGTAEALIRSARAVVIPSISYEAAGRVVLEAYASSVPVLASRIGGLPEVVRDGRTGLLLRPGDTEGWNQGVERLADDAEAERMGQAAFHLWKEKYAPRHGLARLEEAYRMATTATTG